MTAWRALIAGAWASASGLAAAPPEPARLVAAYWATLRGATALGLLALGGPGSAQPAPADLGQLCVTTGRVSERGGAPRLIVDDPQVRAVIPTSDGRLATLSFTYRGATVRRRPLSSGQIRSQVGLKLLAADGCNVLYVMWRLAPRPELVVSMKRNPGQHVHAACGARGYSNLVPEHAGPLPAVRLGSAHELSARLSGIGLQVEVDGVEAWRGPVPGASDLSGPAGFRTDNVRLDLDIATRTSGGPAWACRAAGGATGSEP